MKKESCNCRILTFLIKTIFDVNVQFCQRYRATWMVMYQKRDGQQYSVYWQFSLKKPWLLPKYDPEFGKDKVPLYGWLFFYFGKTREPHVV